MKQAQQSRAAGDVRPTGDTASSVDVPPAVERLTIVDVTPRDGLQDAAGELTTAEKVRLIRGLFAAGVPQVEITSFVSPRFVPKLADAEDVARAVRGLAGAIALIPNRKGFARAVAAKVPAVTFVVSASPRHQQANLGMPLAASLAELTAISAERSGRVRVRGAISCAFGSPFAGEKVHPEAVAEIAATLVERGVSEISLADTTGVATPEGVRATIGVVRQLVPDIPLAIHLHDAGGRAIANVEAAIDCGVRTVESALAGLGGCPFAPNAPRNLDTERLVAWCAEHGIAIGIDADALARVRAELVSALGL
ncbi:hydroxymethylglutaryl-CoA lyase [Alicyclobacillus herbarius]|uniref:hydroxymethylglutaryl-CoA lyase n=1 Tax=Alicyclobacillus herbarius TaxID=122960 RepID=UPI0004170662|nr:hydroxymethylglutaryl-CoA lyase [Alicyclobacillus herbarius]